MLTEQDTKIVTRDGYPSFVKDDIDKTLFEVLMFSERPLTRTQIMKEVLQRTIKKISGAETLDIKLEKLIKEGCVLKETKETKLELFKLNKVK